MEYWSVGVLVRSLGGDSFKIPLLHNSITPRNTGHRSGEVIVICIEPRYKTRS